MFTFFSVIGLFIYCVTRFVSHRKVNHKRASDYNAVGNSFLTILVVFYFELTLNSPEDFQDNFDYIGTFIICLILIGTPAALFYIMGHLRNKKMQKRYKAYYQLVENQGVTDLLQISDITGIRADHVIKDLNYLAEIGYISNLPGLGASMVGEDYTTYAANVDSREMPIRDVEVPVTCFGCGATSSARPGTGKECEYCGNMLIAPD